MHAYLDLLSRIMIGGEVVQTRAYLPSEDRRPTARTIFAAQFRHDLRDGFPAVTTKRLFFDSVVKELLWFLRSETNVKTLGCGIWNSWPGKQDGLSEGECGPIYGAMWRHWPYAIIEDGWWPFWRSSNANRGELGETNADTFDQVAQVVKDLKAVRDDPFHAARRRIILTGWNPPLVPLMGLPPCHTLSQFLPTNGRLNCHLFCRSIDAFVGLPFNISQYALLIHILAAVCGYEPGVLCASITDLHIYDNQFAMVEEQLTRKPYPHPQLLMPDVTILAPDLSMQQVKYFLVPRMFGLAGYKCHPPLKCEVAV